MGWVGLDGYENIYGGQFIEHRFAMLRGAVRSLPAEKLGNLYQPGGQGFDPLPTFWKIFQTLNLSGVHQSQP